MSQRPELHRMAEPGTRLRALALAAALIALSWTTIEVLGRDDGPYTRAELPDLAGLPVLVPQIERLIPPRTGTIPTPESQGGGSP